MTSGNCVDFNFYTTDYIQSVSQSNGGHSKYYYVLNGIRYIYEYI
jgi:hypothetical protein